MHSMIGKKRKKKRVWRSPKGRDNKMREKRKGRPPVVSIGYRQKKKRERKVIVNNIWDIETAKKSEILVLGKMGKKKKIEVLKMAKEKGLDVHGINARRFLKKNEPKKKEETGKKDA